MRTIIIRADASLSIGSGHVMRCRTLARELFRRGAQITFLCRRQSGDLIDLLEQEFSVLVLPELPLLVKETTDGVGFKGRKLYEAWLGCSQEQDAADCQHALLVAGIKNPGWFVVDHYGLDVVWETQLLANQGSDTDCRLLAIDDLADRQHKADLLLDQNFFGETTEKRYRTLVPKNCKQLLGPVYALLGPEYARLYYSVPPRSELSRVLVFFGGVDPANLTGQVLETLMDPALAHLKVDVVLGMQSPHRLSVDKLVANRPQTTLHSNLPSLAGLIARADLSIGAGGATTWERACLGLPSISIPYAENQIPVSQALAHHEFIKLIEFDQKTFREHLLQEINYFLDSAYIQKASQHCRSLTKGNGTEMCSDHLLSSIDSHRLTLL